MLDIMNASTPKEFYGPEDFAQHLIRARNTNRAGQLSARAALSDEGLRRLISLVYFSSQLPEEGRYPHFRVYCSYLSAADCDSSCWIRFCSPYELKDVQSMRRLIPSIPAEHGMLQVVEEGSSLFCIGIIEKIPNDIVDTASGFPGLNRSSIPPGLYLHIEEPGVISACELGITHPIRLKGGLITNVIGYDAIPQVQNWLRELIVGLSLGDETLNEEMRKLIPHSNLRMFITDIWSLVLRKTAELRHGGAFIVIGTDPTHRIKPGVECAEFNFGELIYRSWKVLEKETSASDTQDTVKEWAIAQRLRVRDQAIALANFSSVDGCVLLTRCLNVIGFGYKIDISEESHIICPLADSVSQLGTRHQSAARVCETTPCSLAFVISQDGDLRVFASDDKKTYVYNSHPYRVGEI